MSASRLFELVYLLLEHRQMTAAELAGRFEVSVRTIYRDVDALSAAGVPIFATPGKGGGVALMDHYVLDRALFTEQEQHQLLTALQSFSGSVTGPSADTLSKLSALFRRQEPDWLRVDMSRWGSAGADNSKFEALKSAIMARRVLSFTYVSTYGETTARRALPARLVFKGQAWYLQAYCLTRDAYRTFKVTRILALQVLEEVFERPLSPPLIEDESQIPPGVCLAVRLRFPPHMAYRVYDEFDEACVTRQQDGALLVEVSLPEDHWLYGYLLSFGLGVEVLSPAGLGQKLRRLAYQIAQGGEYPDKGCQL